MAKLTKKDLIAAYKELDKVVGVDPAIEYEDLSVEDFEQELYDTVVQTVEESDKFSKATQAVFDTLAEKYGGEQEDDGEPETDDEETEDEEDEEEDEPDPVPVKKGKVKPEPPKPEPKKSKKVVEPDPEDDEDEEEEIPIPKKGKKPEVVPVKKGKKVVEVDEDDEKETPEPPKKGKKPEKLEKVKPVKKDKTTTKAFSASMVVREMVCKNEKVTLDAIQKELKKRGLPEQSPITMNVRRMEMLNAIRFLREAGKLK